MSNLLKYLMSCPSCEETYYVLCSPSAETVPERCPFCASPVEEHNPSPKSQEDEEED